MKTILKCWLKHLQLFFHDWFELRMEYLALSHQISILQKSGCRPHFYPGDRLFWMFLSKIWLDWGNVLEIIQPNTVKRWRRQGIRFIFSQKSGRSLGGRPPIDKEIRYLIKKMARENYLWGAPRIHSELLILGFKVSQASVSRYLKRYFPEPRYMTWYVFIKNQLIGLEGLNPATHILQQISHHFKFLITKLKPIYTKFNYLWSILFPINKKKQASSDKLILIFCRPNVVKINNYQSYILQQKHTSITIRGSPLDDTVPITSLLELETHNRHRENKFEIYG